MVLDRLRREERRADLAVGQAFGDELPDLNLALGEVLAGRLVTRSKPFAGGADLAAGALGPGQSSELLEARERRAERQSGLRWPASPPRRSPKQSCVRARSNGTGSSRCKASAFVKQR